MLVVVVVILVGAVGYFDFVKKVEPITQQPTSTPIQTEKPASPNPMANWKTYTNSQNGFEIKYPQDLTVINDFGKEGLFKEFDFEIATKIPVNNLCLQGIKNSEWLAHVGLPCTFYLSVETFKDQTLQDYVNKHEDLGSIKAFNGLNNEITIGEKKWIIAGSPEGSGIGNWTLYSLNDIKNKVIIISVTNAFDINIKSINPKALQIISTFKFTS